MSYVHLAGWFSDGQYGSLPSCVAKTSTLNQIFKPDFFILSMLIGHCLLTFCTAFSDFDLDWGGKVSMNDEAKYVGFLFSCTSFN